MHGLINRAIQCFVRDTYGPSDWAEIAQRSGLDTPEFEAMLHYDDSATDAVLDAAGQHLGLPRETVLEDIGTYLVSDPAVDNLRRLLRFGGDDFVEFLHSLDDLPDRARLAVADLDLPQIEVRDVSDDRYAIDCASPQSGFGFVLMGMLRTLADDYGTLVLLNHLGRQGDVETIDISLIDHAFAAGRRFELGARAG